MNLQFIKKLDWDEVFGIWRANEGQDSDWLSLAKERGFNDWESWRRHKADVLGLEYLNWSLYKILDPRDFFDNLIIGPYKGWFQRSGNKENIKFNQFFTNPDNFLHFSCHKLVKEILKDWPFDTKFIGLVRKNKEIVLIDGHHRVSADIISVMNQVVYDYKSKDFLIALADVPDNYKLIIEDK